MYYLKIGESGDQLKYTCRNCGNEKCANENICVSRHQIKKGELKFKHVMNPHVKKSPTLPRINNLLCPNPSCVASSSPHEVIYIRYDNENLRYVYLCTICDTVWKSGSKTAATL